MLELKFNRVSPSNMSRILNNLIKNVTSIIIFFDTINRPKVNEILSNRYPISYHQYNLINTETISNWDMYANNERIYYNEDNIAITFLKDIETTRQFVSFLYNGLILNKQTKHLIIFDMRPLKIELNIFLNHIILLNCNAAILYNGHYGQYQIINYLPNRTGIILTNYETLSDIFFNKLKYAKNHTLNIVIPLELPKSFLITGKNGNVTAMGGYEAYLYTLFEHSFDFNIVMLTLDLSSLFDLNAENIIYLYTKIIFISYVDPELKKSVQIRHNVSNLLVISLK